MGLFATVKSTACQKLKGKMNTRNGSVDEREEGEIVDEYEDIISSDEELTMRQRIEELEAKNAELEKIANISGVYGSGNYDYTRKDAHTTDRYPLVSIDISDDEEFPPAPHMGRISKRRKSLQHSDVRRTTVLSPTRNNQRRARKKSSSSPPPAPLYRASDKLLLSMFHDRVTARTSSKRKRKNKKSHSTKSRKPRDYYINESDVAYHFDAYNVDFEDNYENYSDTDDDRTFSVNREELRVALARNSHRNEQHVSLKDRLIRRKENTDTLNETNTEDAVDVMDVEENKATSCEDKAEIEDDLEEQELRIIALKSAMIRKHMDRKKRNENVAYSPSDFDEIYANIAVSPSINNLDVTDACNSMEISPVPSPKMILSDDDGMDTKPVDMDIANSESECELPSYDNWVPIEQIPLPGSLAMGTMLYTPMPLRYDNGGAQVLMHPEVRFDNGLLSPINLDSELDEEEEALRALLLSKMNSPKVNKVVKEELNKVEELRISDQDISLEAESLRNFLINNMKKKTEPQSSPASVLKEAVRRLTARNTSNSPFDGFVETTDSNSKAINSEIEVARLKVEVECDVGSTETELKSVVKSKPLVMSAKKVLDDIKEDPSQDPKNNNSSVEDIRKRNDSIKKSVPVSASTSKHISASGSEENLHQIVSDNKNSGKVACKPASKISNKNIVLPSSKQVTPPATIYKAENNQQAISPPTVVPRSEVSETVPQTKELKATKPSVQFKQISTEVKETPNSTLAAAHIKTEKSDKSTPKLLAQVLQKQSSLAQKPSPQPLSAKPAISPGTKIVKPNKVINQQTVELKRKASEPTRVVVPAKQIKIEDSANTNRLITAADVPPVKKLIIELRASETETELSSDDSNDGDESHSTEILHRSITVGNEYYDINSPMSLPMESPCDTPTGVASPVPTPHVIVAKSIVNDFFEAKLDQFLKTVRSKVSVGASPPAKKDLSVPSPVINTPVAVRHLPEASQQEYRRLINRMKMLERQKQAKNSEMPIKPAVNRLSTNSCVSTEPVETIEEKITSTELVLDKSTTATVVESGPLDKDTVAKSDTTQKATQTKSKANLLQLYESSYRKAGSTIISSLEKNLKLVQEAKNAKMSKLKCEHRLKELRKEMEEIQKNLKEQQERITKTYPAIRSSHRVIESLKVKRGKMSRTLMSLGRNVIGPSYNIKDEQKSVILEKSRKLAAEIKVVNSMKLSDIEKWETTIKENSVQKIQNTPKTLNILPPKDLSSNSNVKTPIQVPPNEFQLPVSGSQSGRDTATATEIPVSDLPRTDENDESITKAESQEPKSTETLVPETERVLRNGDRDECTSANGHEEALETDGDKQTCDGENGGAKCDGVAEKDEDDEIKEADGVEDRNEQDANGEGGECENKEVGGAKLQDYVSPLSHLRNERQINPNGIVCPYQLMGQCDDKDCKYMHLDE